MALLLHILDGSLIFDRPLNLYRWSASYLFVKRPIHFWEISFKLFDMTP